MIFGRHQGSISVPEAQLPIAAVGRLSPEGCVVAFPANKPSLEARGPSFFEPKAKLTSIS